MIKNFHSIIATGFGSGKSPCAPGTVGSLLAVAMWIVGNFIFKHLGFYNSTIDTFWIILFCVLTILGIFSSEIHAKNIDKEDPGEIVIDEICGQLLAFIATSFIVDISNNYLLIFLAFVFFRIFDITKPYVIGLADQNLKGGVGIMVDDLLSGLAAAALLCIVYVLIIV